ncbi:MAG: RNA polymerase sigma factor [Candidatus Omnitrophica bacterium]|nr:RNA polymerase sigma factor [Candidatus Omnitrophota bacterium]
MEHRQDEELIADYQTGNEEALKMLFERYKKPIFNFALRMLGNRADAEDVTSEVFITLVTKKDAYKPTAKFSTWIFTVTRNASISKLRKRKKSFTMWFQKEDSKDYEQWEVPDNRLPSDNIVKNETKSQLSRAISNLPPEQREAIILREYHQMSYDQIKEIMNCSLDKVKILIYRAREQLRNELPSIISEEDNA